MNLEEEEMAAVGMLRCIGAKILAVSTLHIELPPNEPVLGRRDARSRPRHTIVRCENGKLCTRVYLYSAVCCRCPHCLARRAFPTPFAKLIQRASKPFHQLHRGTDGEIPSTRCQYPESR